MAAGRANLNVPNLVLTGFMGTGKTVVGRKVAERLGRPFVDMDALIEAREGRTIPEIFAQSGEAYFRQVEAALVRELAVQRGLVIATGGGALVPAANRALMTRTGVVICLWADEATLIARLRGQRDRPLLNRPDWETFLRDLLAQRRPAYEALPYHVDTTGRSVEDVVEAVLAIYRQATSTQALKGRYP